MSKIEQIEMILNRVRRYVTLQKAFISMACIVVFATTYMLILPALTLEHDTICQKAAHIHNGDCYTVRSELVCDKEESNGHSHNSSCYETEKVLICGEEAGEEHTHSEACYKEEEELVCGQEETAGHEHGKECYEERTELTCSIEEHEHTEACYPKPVEKAEAKETEEVLEEAEKDKASREDKEATEEEATSETESEKVIEMGDPNADLESASDWEKTLKNVTLTGDWSKDVLEIARTQLGYHESTKNYVVDEDGTKRGYTRYGAWYGDPYGHWCAMYVSFCFHYAQVDSKLIPLDASCQHWIETLSKDSYNLYHKRGSYVPEPGDLIFFNWDKEADSDHVGLVTKVSINDDGIPTNIYTIEGNSSDQCKENIYVADDSSIMGYAELPENPELVEEDKREESVEDNTEESKEEGNLEEHVADGTSLEEGKSDKRPLMKAGANPKANDGSGVESVNPYGTPHNFTDDITNIYVRVNDTYLTPSEGVYQISQNDMVKFSIEYTLPGKTLDETNTITYTVPTSGIIPQSGAVLGTINGQSQIAGTYNVEENGTITIVFNDDFVNQNQEGAEGYPIEGTISLSQNATSITGEDDNDGCISFTDELIFNFHIIDREIETYDLDLTKTQGSVVDEKVTYTIVLSSNKGTGTNDIVLSDILEKMHLTGSVTVRDKHQANVSGIKNQTGTSANSNEMSMILPPLGPGDQYVISYEAEVDASETGDLVVGTNTAQAEFVDENGIKYDPSQSITTDFNRNSIRKSGRLNVDKIEWTIYLNENHLNIAGWVFEDEMMKGIDVSVTGGNASDYTYEKADGKLTFHDNGTNTNKYTIKYTTPVQETDYGTTVSNVATFIDKEGQTHSAEKGVTVKRPNDVSGSKTGNGYSITDGTVILNWHAELKAEDGLAAEWTFEDWLDNEDGYYTMDQLKEIETYFRFAGVTNFEMRAIYESANSKKFEIVNAEASSDGHFQKYKITGSSSLPENTKLEWDYHSTGLSADNENSYGNHTKINNGHQSNASISYVPVLIKANLYGNTMSFDEKNPDKNTISWLLTVNIPAGTTDTEWVIREQVPAGLDPVEITPVRNEGNNRYPEDEAFKITCSKDGQGDYLIQFNPSLFAGTTRYIRVKGLVKASEIPMNTDKTTAVKYYQNRASITFTGGQIYEAPLVEKRVERKYYDETLSKGALYDENRGIITYSIDIDPKKVVDSEDKNYFLVDELTYDNTYCSLELVPKSIVVKETLTGRVLNASECQITEGSPEVDEQHNASQKLYISINSDQLITIEYKYQYTNITQEVKDHLVSNKVILENQRGWHSEEEHSSHNHCFESDATAVVDSYKVYKVDAADHSTFLPGATFDIYRWDNNSLNYVKDSSEVTREDGSLRHLGEGGFIPNIAYKIIETAAPTGYEVNTQPVEFYISDKNILKYPMSIPENFQGRVLSGIGVIYFEDVHAEGERDTQISVKKNWVDHSGKDISESIEKDVKFTLMQIEQIYEGAESDSSEPKSKKTTSLGQYTISKTSGYIWNSNNLPAYRVNKDHTTSVYTYYIEEQEVSGYITSYDRNDSIAGVDAGTITITNTRPDEIESTSLSVEKVWKYSDNSFMLEKDKPKSAVMELWQVKNDDRTTVTKLENKTVTLDASNFWKATITDLPKVQRNGDDITTYTYYFVEQAQEGYKTTYSNGEIAVNQGTIIVTNKKVTKTSVTVSKKWFKDINGESSPIEHAGSIQFNLYQFAISTENTALNNESDKGDNSNQPLEIPAGAIKLNEEPLSIFESNDWTWSGSYDAEEGYTYQYYVEEVNNGNNWIVSYDGQGTDKLTIENTITENTYVLPQTGGSGSRSITMLGLALMFGATSLMIVKKRKEILK